MARKVLSGIFWLASLAIVLSSLWIGGSALLIPAAVGATFVLFLLDVGRHRHLAALDWDLARTALHLLSGVTVAVSSLYWIVKAISP